MDYNIRPKIMKLYAKIGLASCKVKFFNQQYFNFQIDDRLKSKELR